MKKEGKRDVAIKANPSLWEKIVNYVKHGSKYGVKDSWNARKAQYAVKLYKEKGGKYKGEKNEKNSLVKWTKQDWQYSSEKSKGKGRYLPHKVWEKLTRKEINNTNEVKEKANRLHKKKAKYTPKIAKLVKKV